MQVLDDWLVQLRDHYQDYAWLSSHADQLYQAIAATLNHPPRLNDAIDALISICPYAFTRRDFKRWSKLLFDALLSAQEVQDNELQMHIWAQMGESYYLEGKHEEALTSFQTALQRARDGRTAEMMLSAYIGIIKLQSLRLDSTFNAEFVKEALLLSRQVNDPALQARLHLELAVIYTQRYETHIALGHGQMAYAGWHSLQNSVEMARTAFVLSDAYRMAKKPEKAEVFLELASSLFTQLEYGPSYCLIAYEQGLLYLQHRKYEAAQQWFMIALEEGFRLNHAYYIAMSRHSLGIAQTELHQYTNAEANLKAAIPLWEQLENWFYLTNTYHALGYLEGRKGNIVLAENRLKKALIISTKIPDLAVRQWIEQWIIDTIAELK